jgi:glycosyltransferase involved in cell wall biosynthesis
VASSEPLVSVIIPTYNRAHLIGETLDSVLAQTYGNWECIVVDDCSTDNTKAILKNYLVKDWRFKYYHRPKSLEKGANACRNYGVENCNGHFVMFLDSDDILFKSCLESRLAFSNANIGFDFYIYQSILFNKHPGDLNIIPNLLEKEESDISRFISYDYPWNISAALIELKYLTNTKIKWDEQLQHHQDLDFYFRLLCTSPKYIKCENEPDVYIRMGSADKESKKSKKDSHLKSKIRFLNNILKSLKQLPVNQTEFKRRVLGLSISYGILFWSLRRFNLILEICVTFIKNGFLMYFMLYIPLLILVLFNKKYKIIKKNEDQGLIQNFMSYYIFNKSTLGKIRVEA